MELLSKECFRESFRFREDGGSQRGPRSPDYRYRETKEPSRVHDLCTLPLLQVEWMQAAGKDAELWVPNSLPAHKVQLLQTKPQDYRALLGSIKGCGKQKDLLKGRSLHAHILKHGLLEQDVCIGTALLSMYAECGALPKAEGIFDELPTRDIALWNALINAYARHGLGHAALNCLEQMRDDGLFPDGVTFLCILKACGTIKAVKKGKEIHSEVRRRGLLRNNILLGTALVDMYAKCGLMAKAQEVFDELLVRDVALWTALIAGYANLGLGDEALNCFALMRDEGLAPNALTYVCLLKACGSVGRIEKGEHIHVEVQKQGLLQGNVLLGTALVDMYAKCGALTKAQEVFDKLPKRDVTSWNALIAGYARHKLGVETMNCLRRMQTEGLHPDAITFSCMSTACTSIEECKAIYGEVSRRGLLGNNTILGAALVDMCARCGSLEKAREVFDELSTRDIALWNVLMTGYAQQDRGHDVLKCFCQMQREGLSPNAISFVCILKACGTVGDAQKGAEIHREADRLGLLEGNSVLGNSVIDMYAKCGALTKAQEVFDGLSVRSVASWNTLIGGFVLHELNDDALKYFSRMHADGFTPDAITFISVLKACGSSGKVELGKQIHSEVDRQGLVENHLDLGSALVSMYAKCGALAKAEQVFVELPRRDVASWNALMAGYAHHGQSDKALNLFEQMRDEGLVPSTVTYICVLKACGNVGAIDKGEEIHKEVGREGLVENSVLLGNALVDMYAKCGRLIKAQELFNELSERSIAAWNAMISGYAQHGLGHGALHCFGQMQDGNVSPDAVTFVCILKACGSVGAVEKGEQIHALVSRLGLLEKHNELGTALVDMYAKCGALSKAQGAFDGLPIRDVICWTALMTGYAQHKCADEALKCLKLMREEGLLPDATTFACLLKACGGIGAVARGNEIRKEADMQGLAADENMVLGNALVDMYAKCGDLAEAQQVFDKLPGRNVVSWTALIAGYAQLGLVQTVSDLFHGMLMEHTEPNGVTFVILLTACSHAGLLEEAQAYFEKMRNVYGIIPSFEHFACMFDLLSRAGHFEEVIGWFEKISPSDGGRLISSLIGACRTWGNVDLGRWAFELAVQFDAKHAAAYVGMSNICTTTGVQEETRFKI